MADGHGERVGRVIRPGLLCQVEQRLDHPCDLPLVGAAAAADGALDLLGCVPGTGQTALPRRQHHHATGVPDGKRRANVLAEVELLERDGVGLVCAEQLLDLAMDVGQSPLPRNPCGRLDDAAVKRGEAASAVGHNAVAGAGEAGVYTEDDHAE